MVRLFWNSVFLQFYECTEGCISEYQQLTLQTGKSEVIGLGFCLFLVLLF